MIPTKQQLTSGTYKLINGVWHKRCPGPAHDEPEWLPVTPKYYYFRRSGPNKGKPFPQCRLCPNWRKLKSPGSLHGYIPVGQARPFYVEAVNRIGAMELQRRTGVTYRHIATVISGPKKFVQKATLRKIMLELVSLQRKNEYSIDKYAEWQRDRRLKRGLETCKECGIHVDEWTTGCHKCMERFRHKWYKHELTTAEFERIRNEIWISDQSPPKIGRRPKKYQRSRKKAA